jgi:hypothetical protein
VKVKLLRSSLYSANPPIAWQSQITKKLQHLLQLGLTHLRLRGARPHSPQAQGPRPHSPQAQGPRPHSPQTQGPLQSASPNAVAAFRSPTFCSKLMPCHAEQPQLVLCHSEQPLKSSLLPVGQQSMGASWKLVHSHSEQPQLILCHSEQPLKSSLLPFRQPPLRAS